MRVLWLILVLALTGCCDRGAARSEANQSASEAASGLIALGQALGPALTPIVDDILKGSAAFARATVGQDQMPAAVWTPAHIIADPHGFLAAGMSAERHANGTWNLWALGVAAMTVAPFVLYAAKFIPVVGPYVETIGGVLWKTYAAKATKDQEQTRDQLYGHAATILNTALAVLPQDDAAKLEAKIPRPVIEAIMSARPIDPLS